VARVRAAFLAAAERPAAPLVWAAFFAAFDKAECDTVVALSRWSALVAAFARVAFDSPDFFAAARWTVVFFEEAFLAADFFAGTFTPALRASESPMAMA
jgi:hypothetical protein